MPTGYVTTQGAELRLTSESLIIARPDLPPESIELVHLDRLVLVGRQHLTMPVLAALLARGISLALVSTRGRFRGLLTPPCDRRLGVRLGQFAAWSDPHLRLSAARRIIDSKFSAMARLAAEYAANYPELGIAPFLDRLEGHRARLSTARASPELLGIEGRASREWFETLALLNRSGLPFVGRTRRPPRDEINALLSFGYTLLVAESVAALHTAGCDPYLGLGHASDRGRPALALDLVEPFRHDLIDRLVLRLVNRRELVARHFRRDATRGVRLTASGLRRFLGSFERLMVDRGRFDLRRRADEIAAWFRTLDPSPSASEPPIDARHPEAA